MSSSNNLTVQPHPITGDIYLPPPPPNVALIINSSTPYQGFYEHAIKLNDRQKGQFLGEVIHQALTRDSAVNEFLFQLMNWTQEHHHVM